MYNKTLRLSPIVAAIAAIASLSPNLLNAQDVASSAGQAPKAISQLAPNYSYDLRHDEVQGQVVVSFTVTPAGDVANAKVVSSTEGRLVKPTLAALSKWTYSPAMKAGVPVASKVLETVNFTLPDSSQ